MHSPICAKRTIKMPKNQPFPEGFEIKSSGRRHAQGACPGISKRHKEALFWEVRSFGDNIHLDGTTEIAAFSELEFSEHRAAETAGAVPAHIVAR